MLSLLAVALSSVIYLERNGLADQGLGSGVTGTGFVIAATSHETYVLTAAHVLGCDLYGDNCSDKISIRFEDMPSQAWTAERVFSGRGMTSDDLAVLCVPRGRTSPLTIARPRAGEAVAMDGFPQSDVRAAAASSPLRLAPRQLRGSVGEPLSDGRVLLRMSSEPGDSGAPVLDLGGKVVAVLQAAQASALDVGVANESLERLATLVRTTVSAEDKGAGGPVRIRADLLYRNAMAWEKSRSSQQDPNGDAAVQQAEDQDFSDAIRAGSVEAAVTFVTIFPDRIKFRLCTTRIPANLALNVARKAADAGNASAAWGVYRYTQLMATNIFTTQHPQWSDLSKRYMSRAVQLGSPYALEALAASYGNDVSKWKPLLQRAMSGLRPRIAAGDPAAAYHYANDYWTTSSDEPLDVLTHDAERYASYFRAAKIGSLTRSTCS